MEIRYNNISLEENHSFFCIDKMELNTVLFICKIGTKKKESNEN
jgi:hypothetical protein